MYPVQKRRGTANKTSIRVKELGLSALIATAAFMIVLLMSVFLVEKQTVSMEQLPTVVRFGLFLSVLVGGFVAARRTDHGKLIRALETGAVLCILLLGAGLLFGTGRALHFASAGLIVCGGAICGGLLGSKKKRSSYA